MAFLNILFTVRYWQNVRSSGSIRYKHVGTGSEENTFSVPSFSLFLSSLLAENLGENLFKLNPRLTIEPNFNLSFTDFFYIKIKCCQYKGVFTATPYVTFSGKGSTVKNVCPLLCLQRLK
jgi:hypothetical protein